MIPAGGGSDSGSAREPRDGAGAGVTDAVEPRHDAEDGRSRAVELRNDAADGRSSAADAASDRDTDVNGGAAHGEDVPVYTARVAVDPVVEAALARLAYADGEPLRARADAFEDTARLLQQALDEPQP